MPEPPKVVALTPAYNSERMLGATLESLAKQTYPRLVVRISDDASTDGTARICREFAERDERFSWTRQTSNLGWVGNANSLLRQADGHYVFFAYHDDVFHPEFVERLTERLEACPRAAIAFADAEVVSATGEREALRFDGLEDADGALERALRLIRRPDGWWAPVHGLYRTEAVRSAGGLRKNLAGEFSADWPWLVRMALEGPFERVPDTLMTKRLHDSGVAAGWTFEPRRWYAAALSCGRLIGESTLPVGQKATLWKALLSFCIERKRESQAWIRGDSNR